MNKEQEFTHFDDSGSAIMVDVSGKDITSRVAVAEGFINVSPQVMRAVLGHTVKKGDVLGVARVAGIMAVKKTAEMIPLCHPLQLSNCTVDFTTDEAAGSIRASCTVKTAGRTGVEMEALMGVNIALLTIYDMCKAIDKSMEIAGIRLLTKSGGKSGLYEAEKRV